MLCLSFHKYSAIVIVKWVLYRTIVTMKKNTDVQVDISVLYIEMAVINV